MRQLPTLRVEWCRLMPNRATNWYGITMSRIASRPGCGFELRKVGGEALLVDHVHDRPGTALIFEVSPDYEHRVLPLASGGPRRVFTGWFFGQ